MDINDKSYALKAIENDLIIYPIVKDVFESYDINKNGAISRSELEKCMKDITAKIGLKKPSQDAIDKEFRLLDIDKKGAIDFKHFQSFIRKHLREVITGL